MPETVTTVTAYIGQDWTPASEAAFRIAFKNLLWEHGVDSERGNTLIAIDKQEV